MSMTASTTEIARTDATVGPAVVEAADLASYLNHRPPFLFLDRAEVQADFSAARGTRLFTAEEWFFKGHFPDDAIVPGVLLLEVAAQTANVLLSARAGRVVHGYLVNADAVSFKRAVHPGDTVTSLARLTRDDAGRGASVPGSFFVFQTSVLHDGRPCMRATLSVFWAK